MKLDDISPLKDLYVESYLKTLIANKTFFIADNEEYDTKVNNVTNEANEEVQAEITTIKPELKIFLLDFLNPEKR